MIPAALSVLFVCTALAAALDQAGQSRLQRLGKLLERHPERLDVRRARMALLKARMPEPRLEAMLAR